MMLALGAGLWSASAMAAPDLAALKAKLNEARLSYDLSAAAAAQGQIRDWTRQHPDAASERLLGESCLLVANLYRIQFEEKNTGEDAARRALGKSIDKAAREGLAALKEVPADSEVWRMRADLTGVMIRSEFQAQRYRKKLDKAIAQALALDPKNARAYVSKAKTFLFAPRYHGRDLPKGIALLNKALGLKPKLEPALLLRAYAEEQLGKRDLAVADWKTALALNPQCEPAQEKLHPVSGKPVVHDKAGHIKQP